MIVPNNRDHAGSVENLAMSLPIATSRSTGCLVSTKSPMQKRNHPIELFDDLLRVFAYRPATLGVQSQIVVGVSLHQFRNETGRANFDCPSLISELGELTVDQRKKSLESFDIFDDLRRHNVDALPCLGQFRRIINSDLCSAQLDRCHRFGDSFHVDASDTLFRVRRGVFQRRSQPQKQTELFSCSASFRLLSIQLDLGHCGLIGTHRSKKGDRRRDDRCHQGLPFFEVERADDPDFCSNHRREHQGGHSRETRQARLHPQNMNKQSSVVEGVGYA
jgi:hypothetical protein